MLSVDENTYEVETTFLHLHGLSQSCYPLCPDTVVAMKVDSRNAMGCTHTLIDVNPFALNTSLNQHCVCCL